MTFEKKFKEAIEEMKQYIIDEKNLSGIGLSMEDGFSFRLSIPKAKLQKLREAAPMKRIKKEMGMED